MRALARRSYGNLAPFVVVAALAAGPAHAAPGVAVGGEPPTIEIDVPGDCVRKAFLLPVRLQDPDSPIDRVIAFLDGKRFASTRRVRFRLEIPRRLGPGGYRIRVVVFDVDGNRASKTVRLRVCRRR